MENNCKLLRGKNLKNPFKYNGLTNIKFFVSFV